MVLRLEVALAFILFSSIALVYSATGIPGGLDDERAADEEIMPIIKGIERHLHKHYPNGYSAIKPISYRTQVVAGRNYFVRVLVTEKDGKKSHAHLRIYRPFSGDLELTAIRRDVDEKSTLKYFQ